MNAALLTVSVGLIALTIYLIHRERFRHNKWITAWNVFGVSALITWLPANFFFERHDFALIYAIEKGNINEAKIALEKGADINYPFKGGGNFLHVVAIHNGDIKVAQFLIEKGVSLEKKNHDGLTPMDLAKQYNRSELQQYLMSFLNKSPNKANSADAKNRAAD